MRRRIFACVGFFCLAQDVQSCCQSKQRQRVLLLPEPTLSSSHLPPALSGRFRPASRFSLVAGLTLLFSLSLPPSPRFASTFGQAVQRAAFDFAGPADGDVRFGVPQGVGHGPVPPVLEGEWRGCRPCPCQCRCRIQVARSSLVG